MMKMMFRSGPVQSTQSRQRQTHDDVTIPGARVMLHFVEYEYSM